MRFSRENAMGSARTRPDREELLTLLIVMTAFVLRLFRLTFQSFWYDEGWTSFAIQQDWQTMQQLLLSDNHPPAYFILLKLWCTWTGFNDFSMRLFSALVDCIALLLFIHLARNLFGSGILAGFLYAINPMLIYYSQEARMYSLMALFITASYLSLYHILLRGEEEGSRKSRLWAVLFILSTSLSLYTHHFAWISFAAQIAIIMFYVAFKHRMALLLLVACSLILYIPLMGATLQQIGVGRGISWRPHIAYQSALIDLWFAMNTSSSTAANSLVAVLNIATLVVTGIALVSVVVHVRAGYALVIFCILFITFGSLYVINNFLHLYVSRYYIWLVPLDIIILIVGLDYIRRLASKIRDAGIGYYLLISIPAVLWILSLALYYQGNNGLKADWRAVVEHIMQNEKEGDSLVLIGAAPPFLHYYRGNLPWQAFPQINHTDIVQDEADTAARLALLAHQGGVVWLIRSGYNVMDPQNIVEGQIREIASYWDEQWWHLNDKQEPILVKAYIVGKTDVTPEPRLALNISFGDQLRLSSYHLQRDNRNRLYVNLWWQVIGQPLENYNVFVHLLDRNGNILAQGDGIPLSPYFPLKDWQVGQIWRDEHQIQLVPGADADELSLRIGLSWGLQGEHQLAITEGADEGKTYIILQCPVSLCAAGP